MTTTSRAYRIRQVEIGELSHEGRTFSAMGSSVAGRHVTGYVGKRNQLQRWDGAQMLPGSRYVEFKTFRWGEFSDSGIACAWRLNDGRWIVGYSLGSGMLFRGELLTDADEDEARDSAISEAEYWIQIDCEAQEAEREDPERWDGLE